DVLTGGSGGERILQDLEEANAFVVALDAARSWFRYHHLFAGLLQLELRRTASDEVSELHAAAAGWFAGHGFAVEAVRHAQGGGWAVAGPAAGRPGGGGRGGAAAAGRGRGRGRGAARPGRGPARAGADQPGHRRVRDGPVRGGAAAPGAGRRAGPPDRAAVSGVHRPDVSGGD